MRMRNKMRTVLCMVAAAVLLGQVQANIWAGEVIPEETPVPEETPPPEETPVPEETPPPGETPTPEPVPPPEDIFTDGSRNESPTPFPSPEQGAGGGNLTASGGNGGGASGNGGNKTAWKSLKHAIRKAEELVKKKEEELKLLNNLKENTVLYAKEIGVITQVHAAGGEEIIPGKTVITMGQDTKKVIRVKAEQNKITKIIPGQTVELVFSAYPQEIFTGRVTEKSYKAVKDETTGETVFEVLIEVDEGENELLEGMTCSVQFIQKKIEDVLSLSNKAIQMDEKGQFVLIKKADGTTEKRRITGGFSDGHKTEILDGLSEGETVVIEG